MRCSWFAVSGSWLALVSLCWTNPAAAAVAFDYRAPSGCPEPDAAWQQLSAYAPVVLAPSGGAHSAAVLLEISTGDDGYSGRVRVTLSGRVVERQVSDHHCDALLEALVLVAAIALDPARRVEVAPPQPPKTRVLVSSRSLALRTPAAWSAGFAVGARTDVAPEVLATPEIYVAHRRTHFGMVGHYVAGLTLGRTKNLRFDLGEAKFTWAAGRFAACPVGGMVARVSYGLCGIAEFGWLTGEGLSPAAPNTTGGIWVAPGFGLIANVDVGPFQLGALGGALIPIVRDRFYFAPNETVHRANWLGWLAEVSLGMRFGE